MHKVSSLLLSTLFLLTFSCSGQKTAQSTEAQKNDLSSLVTVVEENNEPAPSPSSYDGKDIVTSGVLDKDGHLWFGTTREGVYRYDGSSFTNFSVRDGLCDNEVWSMIEDTEGTLWFGTGNGLCKYDGVSFTHIPIPWDGKNDLWGEACNPNIVTTLLQDRNGDIWLGACGGGAYRYDGETFTSFMANRGQLQSDGLHHNLIKSVLEDEAGNIWFTSLTHGGVSRYDGETITDFGPEDGLLDDMVFASHLDSKGNIWVGCIQTIDGGLYRYDATTDKFINYSKADGLCDNFVMSLFEDRNGTLWVGAGAALCTYDGSNFSTITGPGNSKIEDTRFFVEDAIGNLWFGGRNGKLWRYDGEQLEDFTDKRG